MPKKKCCSDKPACKRCPLRMMKEGTMPDGYTVKRRRLVKIDGSPLDDDKAKKKKKKKSKKAKAKAKKAGKNSKARAKVAA